MDPSVRRCADSRRSLEPEHGHVKHPLVHLAFDFVVKGMQIPSRIWYLCWPLADPCVAASLTVFDLAGIDVDTDCSGLGRFEGWRMPANGNDRSGTVACGSVEIESGTIRFDEGSRFRKVGRLADGMCLACDANLKTDRAGRMVVRASFFTRFADPGETGRIPMCVECPFKHESRGERPGGLDRLSPGSRQRNRPRPACRPAFPAAKDGRVRDSGNRRIPRLAGLVSVPRRSGWNCRSGLLDRAGDRAYPSRHGRRAEHSRDRAETRRR